MHSSASILLFLLCLVDTCHGYSTFKTNCSIPSNSVNFVSSPDTRGTLDILFSCLFAILACTWSIQHLNVPEQRVVKRAAVGAQTDLEMGGEPDQTADESRRGRARRLPVGTDGFWSDFRWTLKGIWRNVKWMLFTIVAPEFIFGKALADFLSARAICKKMKSLAEFDRVEWGLEHGFYVNMGGFAGFEQEGENQVPDEVQGIPLSALHIYLLRITKAGTDERLDVADIIAGRARCKTWIKRLPEITVAEIHEKSQSNLFVKVVTVFQVSWVILQVVVRASKGLSISLLELSVVAFSICAIIIYIVLLHKPQGIQIPTRIICEHGAISNVVRNEGSSWIPMRIVWNPFDSASGRGLIARKRVPNDCIDASDRSYVRTLVGGVTIGSVIFGGIHLAGWNLKFPTLTEQAFWQASSLLVTITLPICFFLGLFISVRSCISICISKIFEYMSSVFRLDHRDLEYMNSVYRNIPEYMNSVMILYRNMLYLLARLFMLIEMIRTLFYLPPDSYISTWASNLPNVS